MRLDRQRAIGLFDSGVGGLTVLQAIIGCLPRESTVYLGDTARVPYGTKSSEVVTEYVLASARALAAYDIKLLVVACNTASAVALPALRASLSIPVLGVIQPGARAAAQVTHSGQVAVIGTPGTIASGAYQKALKAISAALTVHVKACPLFVPLAEEGWVHGEVPRLVAQTYLSSGALPEAVDTLVLGCTHYPLLKAHIAAVCGPRVTLVDSASATAEEVVRVLAAEALLASEDARVTRHFLVTDMPARFATVGARFLGKALPTAQRIDLKVG